MKKFDLNLIPELLSNKKITPKEAVNKLVEFVYKNYPIYGLEKYDEDFREEILVYILEKTENLISHYDYSQGDFFNFFYCFVISGIKIHVKEKSKNCVKEIVFTNDSIENYENPFSYTINEASIPYYKAPYAYKKTDPDQLKKVFHDLKDRKDKANIILALRSAFYIDDEIINNLCSRYKIAKEVLEENLQICRNHHFKKVEKNIKTIEQRNTAYFYHKKYELQIKKLSEDEEDRKEYYSLIQALKRKDSTHLKRWRNHQKNLMSSRILIKTSNKIIAQQLGLCERQVAYYLRNTLAKRTSPDDSVELSDKKKS